MKTHLIWLTSFLLLLACNKESKSPLFADTDIVEVSGVFLQENGEPLINTPIHFRNFRVFAYYDQTIPYAPYFNFLMRLAFPFFPIYQFPNKPVKHQPGYFFDQVKTNRYGEFRFQVYAGQLLRDSEGGINISLVNDGNADIDAFSRYNFVIKQQQTELNPTRLCQDMQVQIQDLGDQLEFSWPMPSEDVHSFELIFADGSNNSLVWAEQLPSTENSLTLPKLIFQNITIKAAIETFYQKEDEFHLSCLGPSKSFQLSEQVPSIARDFPVYSDEVLFTITSLTNGSYFDPIYLQAFDVKRLELDLDTVTNFSTIVIHNLQFSTADNHEISFRIRSSLEEAWQDLEVDQNTAKRFQVYSLNHPISARFIQLEFGNFINDLQEVSLY